MIEVTLKVANVTLAVSVAPTAADLLGLSSSGLHREQRQGEKTHRVRRFVGVRGQRSERADRLEKSLVAAKVCRGAG